MSDDIKLYSPEEAPEAASFLGEELQETLEDASARAEVPVSVHERVAWILALELANIKLELFKLNDRHERMGEAALRSGFSYDMQARRLVKIDDDERDERLAAFFGNQNISSIPGSVGDDTLIAKQEELNEVVQRFRDREEAAPPNDEEEASHFEEEDFE